MSLRSSAAAVVVALALALPSQAQTASCLPPDTHAPEHRAALDAALAHRLPAGGPALRGVPVVQAVYLVPSDRNENPLYAASLDASLRHLQQWYSEHMPGGETFTLAEPALLVLHSDRPEVWYRETGPQNFTTFYSNAIDDALRLMGLTTGDSEHVWLIYPDADAGCGQCGGCGSGSPSGGGFAVMDVNDHHGFLGGPWAQGCEGTMMTYGFRPCRFVGGMGHELGHALGRPHPPGCDQGLPSCDGGALMWAGFYSYPVTYLTADDQLALAEHPFFELATFTEPLANCDAFVAFDRPHLLEPHDGSFGAPFGGTSPWLIWGDIEEAPQHTVEVATDAAFANVVFTQTTGDEWARFVAPGAATEYHWRVRRAPSGPWSDARRFTVDPAVAAEGAPSDAVLALSVAPNPARGAAAVALTLATPEARVAVAVYDVLGREVARLHEGPADAGTLALSLDAARLPSGAYVVRAVGADVRFTERITVVR